MSLNTQILKRLQVVQLALGDAIELSKQRPDTECQRQLRQIDNFIEDLIEDIEEEERP